MVIIASIVFVFDGTQTTPQWFSEMRMIERDLRSDEIWMAAASSLEDQTIDALPIQILKVEDVTLGEFWKKNLLTFEAWTE